MTDFPILTTLIVLPVLGAVALLLIPSRRSSVVLPVAVAASLVTLGASLWMLVEFESGVAGFQFVEKSTWYEPWGVGWHLGIDGISVFLVVLTAFLFPISLAASGGINHRVREYAVSMLLLEAGIIGVFVSLDLLVFFVFWEVMLVPMYFIIGIWGGERRVHAAVKFFLFTALGSAVMFAGILFLGFLGGDGSPTFDFVELLGADLSRTAQFWLFGAFGLSFAIKVPLFPFHTWLPDAHVEAPTAGSVILAGVLLKLGAYGFLRYALPLLADAPAVFTPYILALAIIGVIYGALLALAQTDIKKLVAYSSVSHLGAVM